MNFRELLLGCTCLYINLRHKWVNAVFRRLANKILILITRLQMLVNQFPTLIAVI